jgi:hypothetical protein
VNKAGKNYGDIRRAADTVEIRNRNLSVQRKSGKHQILGLKFSCNLKHTSHSLSFGVKFNKILKGEMLNFYGRMKGSKSSGPLHRGMTRLLVADGGDTGHT